MYSRSSTSKYPTVGGGIRPKNIQHLFWFSCLLFKIFSNLPEAKFQLEITKVDQNGYIEETT